jgi:hypothetical protein
MFERVLLAFDGSEAARRFDRHTLGFEGFHGRVSFEDRHD